MKLIHVPFCFYPDPIGGTEIYVEALARQLQERGHQLLIAAPGEFSDEYVHDGLRVRRFAVSPFRDLRELYGSGDAMATEEFAAILDAERPDVVHLHAF